MSCLIFNKNGNRSNSIISTTSNNSNIGNSSNSSNIMVIVIIIIVKVMLMVIMVIAMIVMVTPSCSQLPPRVAMLGSNTIGRILFMNIFKIAPGAVELFPFAKGDAHMWRPGSPLEVHALKVVETVATAVSLLKDLDTLVPILQGLGLKHVGYGVEKAHYDVVGQAFIATLEVALARHFTEPVKNAYLKVWTIVRDTMISDNYGG